MRRRDDGKCIDCGSDDLEPTSKATLIDGQWIETFVCRDCATMFDIVFDLKLVRSQEHQTVEELKANMNTNKE